MTLLWHIMSCAYEWISSTRLDCSMISTLSSVGLPMSLFSLIRHFLEVLQDQFYYLLIIWLTLSGKRTKFIKTRSYFDEPSFESLHKIGKKIPLYILISAKTSQLHYKISRKKILQFLSELDLQFCLRFLSCWVNPSFTLRIKSWKCFHSSSEY